MTAVIPILVLAYTPHTILYKSEDVWYNEPVTEVVIEDALDLPTSSDHDNLSETAETSDSAFSEPVECRCVEWLREVKGYSVRGDADTLEPNVNEPFVYGVVIQDYDGVRHVSGIKHIMLDRILVEESNYEKCTPTERVLMLDDPHIVGYYYKNPN